MGRAAGRRCGCIAGQWVRRKLRTLRVTGRLSQIKTICWMRQLEAHRDKMEPMLWYADVLAVAVCVCVCVRVVVW